MKKKSSEVSVGVFVILGFIFLTLVLFFVSRVYVFHPGYTVDVMYNYVDILSKGAPVRMAGVRVGEVSSLELVFDEVHKARYKNKINDIIEKIPARLRYGFTGSLPDNNIDKWCIFGIFGGVIYEKMSYDLRKSKQISPVTVSAIKTLLYYNQIYMSNPNYIKIQNGFQSIVMILLMYKQNLNINFTLYINTI